MQRKLTLFPAMVLLALMQLAAVSNLSAQQGDGTQNDGFVLRVIVNGSIKEYVYGDCGWGHAIGWGGEITEDVCRDNIAWVHDITPDSLGCDSITDDLTGKIALIRRGVCNFSLKAYQAEQAGAEFVIIVNHYNTATEGGCSIINMSAGDSATAVTIPAILVGRDIGERIDDAIRNNKSLEICFLLPRFYEATGPYHYATPISQVDTLPNFSIRYVNRTGTDQQDVTIKAEITEPDGNVVVLSNTMSNAGTGLDTTVFLPSYLPPPIKGFFNVLFTNNKYTDSRDSLRLEFVQTDYTFATDNLVNDPGGIGVSNPNFVAGNFIHQEGALCLTGPAGGEATYVTFGVSNIDSVFVPEAAGSAANDVLVFLYDGDVDEDGTIDLSSSFEDMEQVGYGVYTLTGEEVDGVLVDAELTDFLTGGPVSLKPRHPYYVSLYYNGLEAGYGRDIRFSNSLEEWSYLTFPTTVLSVGNTAPAPAGLKFYNAGWGGADVIQRLQLQGYVPGTVGVKPNLLTNTQVLVHPNPATDVVRVDLRLPAVSDVVALTLFDFQGRVVSTQNVRNIQEGRLTVSVRALPAGVYALWVRTAEGYTMRKVSVAH